MREYGHQCVVWQTAINPVVALELLARGQWSGAGVLGPEAFDAVPFLDLLTEYGSPWGLRGPLRGHLLPAERAPTSSREGTYFPARDSWCTAALTERAGDVRLILAEVSRMLRGRE